MDRKAKPAIIAGLLVIAIVVTVRRKRALTALEAAGEKPLPDKVEGIPVDVIGQGAPMEAPEIIVAQQQARTVLEKIQGEMLKTPNAYG